MYTVEGKLDLHWKASEVTGVERSSIILGVEYFCRIHHSFKNNGNDKVITYTAPAKDFGWESGIKSHNKDYSIDFTVWKMLESVKKVSSCSLIFSPHSTSKCLMLCCTCRCDELSRLNMRHFHFSLIILKKTKIMAIIHQALLQQQNGPFSHLKLVKV